MGNAAAVSPELLMGTAQPQQMEGVGEVSTGCPFLGEVQGCLRVITGRDDMSVSHLVK